MTKPEVRANCFVIWTSDFIRHSDFVIRHSFVRGVDGGAKAVDDLLSRLDAY
jgi:hypothetical protein